MCAFGLTGQVVADHGCTRLQCGIGVKHHWQLFVFDFDSFYCIGSNVAVVGDDDGHFLHLEVNFLVGQNSSYITRQRGHPVQLEGLEVIGSQDGVHTRNGKCCFFVYFDNTTMRNGRAHNVHVQHAGHLDIVYVVALALDKASVFFAQARSAHASQREFAGFNGEYRCVHVCLQSNIYLYQAATGSCNFLAAYWTALMMF